MRNETSGMRFSLIETKAVLPDGRTVSAWRSYPEGIDIAAYREIDRQMARAFGNDGTVTKGTPIH